MKKIIFTALLFATALGPLAGDWPQWRGPNRDGISRETGLLQAWPSAGPKRVWLSRDIGIGYSAPVVAKGRLFVMGTKDGKEQLFAKEAKSGKTVWTAALGGILSNNWGDGPRGAATVDGDRVYALGAKGGLICANAEDGRVNWRVELVKDLGGKVPGWGYTESVLVEGDLVICTPGGKRGTLAALDKKLREHTQFELINLQEDLGVTFIVVTHDQEEAMTLSSRIAVMNAGAFEQIGTPGEVYEYPANRFIADFIGNINLLEATVIDFRSGRVRLNCEQTQCVLDVLSNEQPANGSRQWIAVRPEKIHIDLEKPSAVDHAVLKGTVLDLGYFGNLSVYRVQLPSGTVVQVSAPNRRRSATHKVEWDDKVFISWDTASAIMLTK